MAGEGIEPVPVRNGDRQRIAELERRAHERDAIAERHTQQIGGLSEAGAILGFQINRLAEDVNGLGQRLNREVDAVRHEIDAERGIRQEQIDAERGRVRRNISWVAGLVAVAIPTAALVVTLLMR